MELSLEQIHALIAVADNGTITAAAKSLNKTHTAVLYQIRQLESQLGLSLLEREGYRSRLTPKGELFLAEARNFYEAEERLRDKAQQIKMGNLGRWHLVYDAIFPVEVLLEIASTMASKGAISFQLLSDSLRGVEKTFWKEEADCMISLIPPTSKDLVHFEIGSLKSVLVVHKSHPLLTKGSAILREGERWLSEKLIVVRALDPHWPLSADRNTWDNKIVVNDFYAKKIALMKGLGLGWMPQHLIANELKSKILLPVTSFSNFQRQFPVYYSVRARFAEELLFAQSKSMLESGMLSLS